MGIGSLSAKRRESFTGTIFRQCPVSSNHSWEILCPMPDYMLEQMPELMPRVMDNLMPHMIGDVVPLVTQPMVDYLTDKAK